MLITMVKLEPAKRRRVDDSDIAENKTTNSLTHQNAEKIRLSNELLTLRPFHSPNEVD